MIVQWRPYQFGRFIQPGAVFVWFSQGVGAAPPPAPAPQKQLVAVGISRRGQWVGYKFKLE